MMDYSIFLVSSSEDSESDENSNLKILRRQLRDKSDPLSMPTKAFIKRFRLNKDAFYNVLSTLNIKTHSSTAVSPVLQLSATLSLLASGGFQHSIGNDFLIGLSQSSVSTITDKVLVEMENKLCPKYIKFDPRNCRPCKEWFMEKYKIAGVIGCIDGTHFGLQKPTENEHMYYNRKGFHSLNSMIICDHEYRINAINSKYGGAAHDSFVWKQSEERNVLEDQFSSGQNRNSWLLGDSGYPLEPWCLTPYRRPADLSAEANFNGIHSKARSIVERTIGILKARWKILINDKRGRYTPEKIARFGNVCAALHNICIEFKIPLPKNYTNTESNALLEVQVDDDNNLTRIGKKTGIK